MNYRISFALVVVAFVLGGSWQEVIGQEVIGQEVARPEAVSPRQRFEQQQMLKEISALRKEMGGSVLRDTILESNGSREARDPQKQEAEFQSGLKSLLESEQNRPNTSDAKPNKFSSGQVPPVYTQLRVESAALDRLSNELELLRQYQQADELRVIAGRLRRMARLLDVGKPAKNIASTTNSLTRRLSRTDNQQQEEAANKAAAIAWGNLGQSIGQEGSVKLPSSLPSSVQPLPSSANDRRVQSEGLPTSGQ